MNRQQEFTLYNNNSRYYNPDSITQRLSLYNTCNLLLIMTKLLLYLLQNLKCVANK